MDKVIDKTTGFHYTIIDNYILENAELTGMEQIIYVHLKKYSALGNKCFPGIPKLSKDLSCSENTVRKQLKSLQSKGFINIVQRFNQSNEYTLLPYPEYTMDQESKDELTSTVKFGIGEVLTVYQNNINPTYGSMERDKLIKAFEEFGDNADIVIKAIEIAVEQNARKIKYIEAILNDWYQQGIKTLEQVEAYTKIRESKKGDESGKSNKDDREDKEKFNGFKPQQPKRLKGNPKDLNVL